MNHFYAVTSFLLLIYSTEVNGASECAATSVVFATGYRFCAETAAATKSTCAKIKATDPNASSGVYALKTATNKNFEAYCEMEINGGGYTFLSKSAMAALTNDDIQAMITDKQSVLLRVKKATNHSYAVLKQVTGLRDKPLGIFLNQYPGYGFSRFQASVYGSPYLYVGFTLKAEIAVGWTIGINVNGEDIQMRLFSNADAYSSLVIFANPGNKHTYYSTFYYFPFNLAFQKTLKTCSRQMADKFFMVGEYIIGDWGNFIAYDLSQSSSSYSVLNPAAAVGFR